MTISRRKLLRLFPFVAAGFVPEIKAEANADPTTKHALGYQLHDDQSVILLRRYARSLALKNSRARCESQKMFHKTEQLILDRQNVTGYGARLRWKAYVEAYEDGDLPPARG